MPTAALSPCPVCHQVGCTLHLRTQWRTDRPAPVRIRGRRLQQLRMEMYVREPRCRLCGRVLLPAQMIRDHIVPLAEGGQDVEANTQPLCQGCSDAKSQEEALRGRGGAWK